MFIARGKAENETLNKLFENIFSDHFSDQNCGSPYCDNFTYYEMSYRKPEVTAHGAEAIVHGY